MDAVDARKSFSAGEVSPLLFAHDDLARWRLGLDRVENFVVLLEGGLTRAPGTKFVLAHKNETQVSRFVRFRYSASDNYIITLNGGVARFLKDGGFLESPPGTPYELVVPYVAADLDKLREQQDGNWVYLACDGYEPQKLVRAGHTSWSLTPYRPTGGPVDAQNLDETKTIGVSATLGSITLTANFDVFVAGDVNSVWRLDEGSLALIPEWRAGETGITIAHDVVSYAGSSNIGDLGSLANAFDGNSATTASGGGTGVKGYVGKQLAAATAITKFTLGGNPSLGIAWHGGSPHEFANVELYGKNGAPAHATDGTLLFGPLTTVNWPNPTYEYFTIDPVTPFTHVWVVITPAIGGANIEVAELVLYKFSAGGTPVLRRWQGRVYEAVSAGTAGPNPPTHDEGTVLSQPSGVAWKYRHRDRGFVRIDAYTNARVVTATVLERLPDSVMQSATYRWFKGEWCVARGWPKRVAMHDGRLFFARDDKWWLARPGDNDDMEVLPTSDTANPDTALAVKLRPDKVTLPLIEWMHSAGGMVLGLRDSERIVHAGDLREPLTIEKLGTLPGSDEGSTAHEPAAVDGGVVFIGRNKKRLHFTKIDQASLQSALDSDEITKTSRRLLSGKAKRLSWQRDPNRFLYVMQESGALAGVTFMPKEQIVGFMRRPFNNGSVEDLASLPTSDEGVSESYLSMRRTINAATRRYYERVQEFFEPVDVDNPTAAGAWYLDCAIRFQGAPTKVFSGASHLAGQTCRVFADGAQRENVTVAGDGTFALKENASDVIIGIPLRGYIKTLPIEIPMPGGGTSRGKVKHPHHVNVSLFESAGGRVRANGGDWSTILETGDAVPGQPIKLFTGTKRIELDAPSSETCVLEFEVDHALPFTLSGFEVEMEVKG